MLKDIIKPPFLKKEEIRKRADDFRSAHWGVRIPVDIEKVMEIKLKIGIIPTPDMKKRISTDALITSEWNIIYVDKDAYDNQEARLNYSLAHELGHYVLHKKFI